MHSSRSLSSALAIVATALGQSNNARCQETPRAIYQIVSDRIVDSGSLGELAIDSVERTLYGAGTRVLDIDRGSVVGTLPPTLGHGFAFANNLGRGISRRGAIFDLTTKSVLKTGRSHSAATVAYDVATGRAAINFDSVTIIDVASGKTVATIGPGGSMYVVSDNRGHFITDESTDSIYVIDASKMRSVRRWSIAPCEQPGAMTVDSRSQRVFIACGNRQLMVMDYMTGVTAALLPMHWSADQLAFDAERRLLFVPTDHDTLTIVKQSGPDTYALWANLDIGRIKSAIAIDSRTHRLFLVHFDATPHPPNAVSVLVLSVDVQ